MKKLIVLFALLLLIPTSMAWAQEDQPEGETLPPPSEYQLSGFTYEAQWMNNCGPATLTMGLSHYGYSENQRRAANWLKPHPDDKNVSPWQMVEYVNTQVPEIPVYALYRYGGTLDTLRTLISNGFVILIESGYDPPNDPQGWMGHYLLVIGYNDYNAEITTHDSFNGANLRYSYEHVEEFWQHFNYTYLVLYTDDREDELLELLGDDADEYENYINAFNIAREEATVDPEDSFAWHNMGAMLVELAKTLDNPEYYEQAVVAFDQARNVGDGLPWRMLWYQFWMYEAYNAVGRYDETINLARGVLDTGGGTLVEETYYYAGIAREGLGERQRAIDNYVHVVNFNPNFHLAQERLDALRSG